MIADLLRDARYSLRQLSRAPLFTLSAVLSLALGIGAVTAVFTVAERVLLRSLPVPSPEELVFLTDQRTAEALLHGVTAGDAVTFAGAAALVAIVSLTGFSLPLRAASRLDPVAAIRSPS